MPSISLGPASVGGAPGVGSGSTASITGTDDLGVINFTLVEPGGNGIVLFQVAFDGAYSAIGAAKIVQLSGTPCPGTINISAGIWQFVPTGIGAGSYAWAYKVDRH
jgi:hypothetical protein